MKRICALFLECKSVFALVTKEVNKDIALYAFMIVEEDVEKRNFLRDLSRHIANATCRADYVSGTSLKIHHGISIRNNRHYCDIMINIKKLGITAKQLRLDQLTEIHFAPRFTRFAH